MVTVLTFCNLELERQTHFTTSLVVKSAKSGENHYVNSWEACYKPIVNNTQVVPEESS